MEPLAPPAGPIRRLQVVAVSVVGALTLVAFLLSLLVDGAAGEALGSSAVGLAILCGVIGVSFAVVGNGGARR